MRIVALVVILGLALSNESQANRAEVGSIALFSTSQSGAAQETASVPTDVAPAKLHCTVTTSKGKPNRVTVKVKLEMGKRSEDGPTITIAHGNWIRAQSGEVIEAEIVETPKGDKDPILRKVSLLQSGLEILVRSGATAEGGAEVKLKAFWYRERKVLASYSFKGTIKVGPGESRTFVMTKE